MGKSIRYKGEFVSRQGELWRVEIQQESQGSWGEPVELTLDASPLEIEWDERERHEVICGSSAELRVVSESDRQFVDMYQVEPCAVRLDVYCGGRLYWSGCLDTEFYEEPYETARGYVVRLTFSDFGALGRVDWQGTGVVSVNDVVERAVAAAQIKTDGIDTTMVTTTVLPADSPSGPGVALMGGSVGVLGENFADDDGDALTMEDALVGVLQPFALRVVQRGGVVWIYDINGLRTLAPEAEIEWDGDSQTLGTAKTASRAEVKLNAGGAAEVIRDELEWKAKETQDTALGSLRRQCYWERSNDKAFTGTGYYHFFVHLAEDKCEGLASIGTGCRYFRIEPETGGSEAVGVAYTLYGGGRDESAAVWYPSRQSLLNAAPGRYQWKTGGAVMRTRRYYLHPVSGKGTLWLRLRLELLASAKYNPWASDEDDYYTDANNQLKILTGFLYVPFRARIYDGEGLVLWHYENEAAASGSDDQVRGQWKRGDYGDGVAWLEYYSMEDFALKSGIGDGWSTNRRVIGRPDGRHGRRGWVHASTRKTVEGEFMPLPPCAGYIEVEILAGLAGFDCDPGSDGTDAGFADGTSTWEKKGLASKLRWLLYKMPELVLSDSEVRDSEVELEDITRSGWINRSAKEEIKVDTICGTADAESRGMGYGLLLNLTGYTHMLLGTVRRGGKTGRPEELLIGTIYSQMADRKTTLSGEAMMSRTLCAYTERNQGEARYMITHEVQDVIMGCSEADYCEIAADEWDKIEEAEDDE